MLMVLIGRSGSGKSSIAENLIKRYGYVPVRTATTRERRVGEAKDAYHFLSHDMFMKKVKNNEFVEWCVYGDSCYGILRKELQTEGKQVIVLTPEGAEAIKKEFPDTFIVMVDVDMKTSALRAIKREPFLDPGKLYRIADRGATDDCLFRNQGCDYHCQNENGAVLDNVVDKLAVAHSDFMV